MSRGKSPAFQFYPDNFVSGAPAFMKPLETHVYVWLLCLEWTQDGFQFDERNLASWCRVPVGQFRQAWPKVSESFVLRDGRYYNPRLDRERERQREHSEHMAANGRKGGRPKAAGKPEQSHSLAVALPEESNGKATVKLNESFPSLSPTPSPITASAQTPRGAVRREKPSPASDHWLAPACAVYETRYGASTFPWGEAGRHLKRVHEAGAEPQSIASNLARYLEATDPQFLSLAKFAKTFDAWCEPSPIVDPDTGLLTPVAAKRLGLAS